MYSGLGCSVRVQAGPSPGIRVGSLEERQGLCSAIDHPVHASPFLELGPPTLLLVDTCQPHSQADCMVTCVPVLICHQDPCWILLIPTASSYYRHIQATHITMYAHTPRTPRVPYITPLNFSTPRDILCTPHPQHAYPSHQSEVPVIRLFTLSASLCPCYPVAAITVFL